MTVVCRRYELVSAVQLMMPGRGGSFILHETLIVILQKVIELHKMQLKIDLFLVFLFIFVNGKKETFLSFFLSFFSFFLSFFPHLGIYYARNGSVTSCIKALPSISV